MDSHTFFSSALPEGGTCQESSDRCKYTLNFSSHGEVASYPEMPFPLFSLNYVLNSKDQYNYEYKLTYEIVSDKGKKKTGKLYIRPKSE